MIDKYPLSELVDPAKVAQYCPTTLSVRISKHSDLIDKTTRQFAEHWKKTIGFGYEGCGCPHGNFIALVYPEGFEKESVIGTNLCELYFVYDDFTTQMGREAAVELNALATQSGLLSSDQKPPTSKPPTSHSDIWDTQLQQIQAEIYLEIISADRKRGSTFLEAINTWFVRQASCKISDFRTLDELVNYRYDDGACYWTLALSSFSARLNLTIADFDSVQHISRPVITATILANDLHSFEREIVTEIDSDGNINNSVWYLMKTLDLTVAEAKDWLLSHRILPLERKFLEEREKYLSQPEVSSDMRRYLELIEFMHSGNWFWSTLCPRYSKWRSDTTLHKWENGEAFSLDFENAKWTDLCRPRPESSSLVKTVKESKINTIDNSVVMGPIEYLRSMPSKNLRSTLLKALNVWLKAPKKSVARIERIVANFHDASLLLDDIEDNSSLRRGMPATHEVFGTAQTINSANYLYILAFNEFLMLENAVTEKGFIDELQRLHIGQSKDLYWTHSNNCPTIDQYMDVIREKTGGLFCLAGHLLFAEGVDSMTVKKDDICILVTLLGEYFQMRDDYVNLFSPKYHKEKGFAEDLDGGKHSLPIIHVLQHSFRCQMLQSLFAERCRRGSMSVDHKNLILSEMEKTGTIEYTKDMLTKSEAKVYAQLSHIEKITGEKNFILRLLLSGLAIHDD